MSVETDFPFKSCQFRGRTSHVMPQRSVATQPGVRQPAENLPRGLIRLGVVLVPDGRLPFNLMRHSALQLIHGRKLSLSGCFAGFEDALVGILPSLPMLQKDVEV